MAITYRENSMYSFFILNTFIQVFNLLQHYPRNSGSTYLYYFFYKRRHLLKFVLRHIVHFRTQHRGVVTHWSASLADGFGTFLLFTNRYNDMIIMFIIQHGNRTLHHAIFTSCQKFRVALLHIHTTISAHLGTYIYVYIDYWSLYRYSVKSLQTLSHVQYLWYGWAPFLKCPPPGGDFFVVICKTQFSS